jgi:hypothetical protein
MSGAITGTVIRSQEQSPALRALVSERLFYVIAGSLMLIATAMGFRAFLTHGKGFGGGEITRQIFPLVVVHGCLAMFSWIVLFLVQSIFILKGNPRLHMRIGVGGAVLAGVIVPLGSVSAILSARYNPELYQFFRRPQIFPGNHARRDALLRRAGGSCNHLSSPPRNPPAYDALGVIDDHLRLPRPLPLHWAVCHHAAVVRTWSSASARGAVSCSPVGNDSRA